MKSGFASIMTKTQWKWYGAWTGVCLSAAGLPLFIVLR